MSMYAGYFNYRFHLAESRWQRRDFSRRWWALYQEDPRWVPPDWRTWSRLFHTRTWHPHLARMDPQLLAGEALPRRRRPPRREALHAPELLLGPIFEVPVVAGVLLTDPRRQDALAYAALLHVANDRESLERFLARAEETLAPRGVRGLILPTGLSPHLGSGVLQAPFDVLPPPHSAYGPPYVPELFQALCRPMAQARLYHVDVPEVHVEAQGPAHLSPVDPARMSRDDLALAQVAMAAWGDFPPPDALEIDFLWRWMARERIWGWVARVEGQAVGLAVVQADRGWALHRTGGGRGWLRRLWLAWLQTRPVARGHVVWLGVLPQWRRRGIGRQLWHRILDHARGQGWRRLSIGPVSTRGPGPGFLAALGAQPLQRYLLHRVDWR